MLQADAAGAQEAGAVGRVIHATPRLATAAYALTPLSARFAPWWIYLPAPPFPASTCRRRSLRAPHAGARRSSLCWRGRAVLSILTILRASMPRQHARRARLRQPRSR